MFKRRLAVLGAVGVLVLTGLGGSAMADEAPSAAPGTKVTCTTSDGKTIAFAERARVATPRGELSTTEAREGIAIARTDDGGITIEALPEGAVPDGDWARAVPATEAEGLPGADGGQPARDAVKLERGTTQKTEDADIPTEVAKTVAIKCESK